MGGTMKKALILSLMLGASVVALPAVDVNAATTNSVVEPQINVQIGRNRRRGWNRRTRIVTSTRTSWVNGVRYRETIRTTYFANGRTRTVVVNRVRLGGRRGYRNY